MSTAISAALGIVFLILSFAATFLMFYLWGFPFDKATRTSAAPKSLMRLHRVIGYLYALLYVVMMSQMLPRLWQYQIELPPRTVAHLMLGFLIGIILVVKISILRFFRHLEEWMPYLGTALFACTVLLMGLSLPFAYREQALTRGGDVFSATNRQRVAALLPQANLPANTPLAELSTVSSLRHGRSVMLNKCVRCHDMKTVLQRTRTPDDWAATVHRMAEKPAVFAPITDREQLQITAYLIAITPDLQRSTVHQQPKASPAPTTETPIDLTKATATFQRVCSQCHATSEVDKTPPKSPAEVDALIQRMQGNGMHASDAEIREIRFYLNKLPPRP